MTTNTRVVIPVDMYFSDLKLFRETDGGVTMDFDVLERICESSGIDTQFFLDQEHNITQLVIGWYESHIAAGGAPDPP